MWWEELGPDEARSLLAAGNEPAEKAFASTSCAPTADAVLGQPARRRGVDAPVRHRYKRTGRMAAAQPETIVVEGPTGDLVPELVAAGC